MPQEHTEQTERDAKGYFMTCKPYQFQFRASGVLAEHRSRYHQPGPEQNYEGLHPHFPAPDASDFDCLLLRNERRPSHHTLRQPVELGHYHKYDDYFGAHSLLPSQTKETIVIGLCGGLTSWSMNNLQK